MRVRLTSRNIFRQGCGIALQLGVHPWVIAWKLKGWVVNHPRRQTKCVLETVELARKGCFLFCQYGHFRNWSQICNFCPLPSSSRTNSILFLSVNLIHRALILSLIPLGRCSFPKIQYKANVSFVWSLLTEDRHLLSDTVKIWHGL